MTVTPEHLLLTAKEARQLLGVGKGKFARWVREGVIPCYTDPETGWRHYPRQQLVEAAAELGRSS